MRIVTQWGELPTRSREKGWQTLEHESYLTRTSMSQNYNEMEEVVIPLRTMKQEDN